MNKNIFFFTIILIIVKIYCNTIFPYPKSDQQVACESVRSPSLQTCTAVVAADKQESCCFVTYKDKDKNSEAEYMRCGYLENTQFGIKVYKNLFGGYREVKVNCKSNYITGLLLSFFIIFLFI